MAIIAHVDHGKTTLVDNLLKQSGNFRSGELEKLEGGQHGLILDSNDLERERGITILGKNIAIRYAAGRQDVQINLIDTPGHADFGGEVERVLKMADGCLLLVDAAEGVMPQTRFVLRKAFECGLRPIVVINKIDRPDARINDVLNGVFDLFVELDADDATLDFPTIYASGRAGHRHDRPERRRRRTSSRSTTPSCTHVPPPEVDVDGAAADAGGHARLQRLRRPHRHRPGRSPARSARASASRIMKHDGQRIEDTVKQLYVFDRLGRIEADEVAAGDICAVVGLEDVDIGDTMADFDNPVALPPITVDEPTLEMIFRINDSPFVGQDGTYVTSRQLRERLMKELESNVALRVTPDEVKRDEFHVAGRGLLHLSILLENMRREGFELSVGKPRVINKEVNGVLMEPIEYLVIEVPPALGRVGDGAGAAIGGPSA